MTKSTTSAGVLRPACFWSTIFFSSGAGPFCAGPPRRAAVALNARACWACWSLVLVMKFLTRGGTAAMKGSPKAEVYVPTARFSIDAAVCMICTSGLSLADAGDSNNQTSAVPRPSVRVRRAKRGQSSGGALQVAQGAIADQRGARSLRERAQRAVARDQIVVVD